jgi:hypothetical protein
MPEFSVATPVHGVRAPVTIADDSRSREDSGKSIVNVARFESGDTRSKLEQPEG